MNTSTTIDLIRDSAGYDVFQRGEEYYRNQMVRSVTQRGDLIQAEVFGSEPEPYSVSVTLEEGNVTEVHCSCPYEYGAWCKHVVATLLFYLRNADAVEEKHSYETLLAPLSREQLLELVARLAAQHADVARNLDEEVAWVQRKSPDSPEIAPVADMPLTIKPEVYRRKFSNAIRDYHARMDYGDYEYDEDAVSEELTALMDEVAEQINANNVPNALAILEVVTEELVDSYAQLQDYDLPDEDALASVARAWAEALLTSELTPAEREHWERKLRGWQQKMSDDPEEGWLASALAAVRQGWSYPPLVRVLEGQGGSAWEGDAPPYANQLTQTRLKVLERQARLQEYVYLAQAEGLIGIALLMLVRMGRVVEVVQTGLQRLTNAQDSLALAIKLDAMGATEEALQIAEAGLQLEAEQSAERSFYGVNSWQTGPKRSLALWLRDRAEQQQRPELALQAAQRAVELGADLESWKHLERLADEQWPTLREPLVLMLRDNKGYHSGRVDIYLYEGLIDDAIAAVENAYDSNTLLKVMDAAIYTRPAKVITLCRQKAESYMDAGKSDRYYDAAQWLRRVKAAHEVLGTVAEWKQYLEDLLSEHRRKRNLVPLLEKLR